MFGSRNFTRGFFARHLNSQFKKSKLTAALIAGLAAVVSLTAVAPEAEAKRPGSTYCFVGKCHRVKSISETEKLVGKTIHLMASHYSDCKKDRYNPCGLTSSGERFHPDRPDNAASPIYPDGTVLLVRNPATKAAVVLRINNAGPYWGNRKLDVSYATAQKLGFVGRGVAKLETRILQAPNNAESRYVKRREYRPLPGFIGRYENLEKAERTAVAMMVLDATAASVLAQSSGAALAIAARRESKTQRTKRIRTREKLEPIIKTMRMIASLDVTPARQMKAETARVKAAPTRVFGDKEISPARQLADVAMQDPGFLEERVTKTAVKMIKTAEVGAQDKDSWQELLRPRLGLESLIGYDHYSAGRRLPHAPLPDRTPVKYTPVIPTGLRQGMTG